MIHTVITAFITGKDDKLVPLMTVEGNVREPFRAFIDAPTIEDVRAHLVDIASQLKHPVLFVTRQQPFPTPFS